MSTVRRISRRGGLLAAVAALALALCAPTASAEPKVEATKWLASQLQASGETQYCESFSPAGTVGQTIDCMLAFKAAGAEFGSQRKATYAYAIANMDDYVGEAPCTETKEPLSAGAVAKLAVGVLAQGEAQPTSVGGRNLIADLLCLQAESGRFSDKNQTDFSNVFGQSLAIVALKACQVGCTSPPKGLAAAIEDGASYLRGQQCAESAPASLDGAFRSPLGLEAGECNDEPPFPEGGPNLDAVDVDSTGIAVLGLLADGGAESKAAAAGALEWLEAQEQQSGVPPVSHWESYCDFEASETLFPSVNSTAAATMAYVEGKAPIGAAQGWLEGVVEASAEGEGKGGMPACGSSGPSDVLATAQGILALSGTSYSDLAGL